MRRAFVLFAAGLAISACATGVANAPISSRPSDSAPPVPREIRDIRDLAIVPSTKTACPGKPVSARYEAILGDGSRVELAGSELSRLALRGIAAVPATDGTWTTSSDPLESIASGFLLSVSLANDPGVHADTVLVPSYSCERLTIGLPVSDPYTDTKARVRLGLFASPFYDSVAVVVIEPEGAMASVLVIDPAHMRPRAVQVSATGSPGKAGRPGNPGNDGAPCEDGTDGTDGDPGESGESGGRVDLVVEAEAPWLESLVGVTNSGGRGGKGGQGGRAGRPGARSGQPTCNPKAGRPGRAGNPGGDGAPGPYPKTTTVAASLLWRGSPLWFDSTARANLERLMEHSVRRK